MAKQNEMGWPKANLKGNLYTVNATGTKTLEERLQPKNYAETNVVGGKGLNTSCGSVDTIRSK